MQKIQPTYDFQMADPIISATPMHVVMGDGPSMLTSGVLV